MPNFFDNYNIETRSVKNPEIDAQLRDLVTLLVNDISVSTEI